MNFHGFSLDFPYTKSSPPISQPQHATPRGAQAVRPGHALRLGGRRVGPPAQLRGGQRRLGELGVGRGAVQEELLASWTSG